MFSYLLLKQLTIIYYLHCCNWMITPSILLHIFVLKKAEWKDKNIYRAIILGFSIIIIILCIQPQCLWDLK